MCLIVLDRHQGSATAWPMAIDDLDVGQDFPVPLTYFENGVRFLLSYLEPYGVDSVGRRRSQTGSSVRSLCPPTCSRITTIL